MKYILGCLAIFSSQMSYASGTISFHGGLPKGFAADLEMGYTATVTDQSICKARNFDGAEVAAITDFSKKSAINPDGKFSVSGPLKKNLFLDPFNHCKTSIGSISLIVSDQNQEPNADTGAYPDGVFQIEPWVVPNQYTPADEVIDLAKINWVEISKQSLNEPGEAPYRSLELEPLESSPKAIFISIPGFSDEKNYEYEVHFRVKQ